MKVAYSTETRLALKETRKFMWGVIFGGFICTTIVYAGWMIYLKEIRDNIPLKVLCIPLAGPLVVIFGACFFTGTEFLMAANRASSAAACSCVRCSNRRTLSSMCRSR